MPYVLTIIYWCQPSYNYFYYYTYAHIYTGPEHIDYSSYSIHNTNHLNRNSSGVGEVPETEKSMRFSTWGARSLEHAGICLCYYHTVYCMRYICIRHSSSRYLYIITITLL